MIYEETHLRGHWVESCKPHRGNGIERESAIEVERHAGVAVQAVLVVGGKELRELLLTLSLLLYPWPTYRSVCA